MFEHIQHITNKLLNFSIINTNKQLFKKHKTESRAMICGVPILSHSLNAKRKLVRLFEITSQLENRNLYLTLFFDVNIMRYFMLPTDAVDALVQPTTDLFDLAYFVHFDQTQQLKKLKPHMYGDDIFTTVKNGLDTFIKTQFIHSKSISRTDMINSMKISYKNQQLYVPDLIETLYEIEANERNVVHNVRRIQNAWRECISDPGFTMCQNRLQREFSGFEMDLITTS